MRFGHLSRMAATGLLLTTLVSTALPTTYAAESVAQKTLSLIFPDIKPEDNLAVDPGSTLGSYLIAYFARLDHTIFSEQDARRKGIALGLIAKEAEMSTELDNALLRNLSYRHRILFTDDPVAAKHGADGDMLRHITVENYPTLKVANDYITYYTNKLKDTTLPPRLAETLMFRKIRFEYVKKLISMKTPAPVIKNGIQLNVPYFKQERSLSCEMASLRSLLAFYGYSPTEQALIDILGVTSPLEFKDGIWGDPQLAFVGKIDGRQSDYSGYGTLWRPVARVGQAYKPELNYFEGGNLQTLTASLDAGHPVQVWTVVAAKGGFMELKWKTPDGKDIIGYNGEHTWLVDGYSGTSDKPTSFHVLDPYFGPKTVSASEMTKQWARFNNSGVKVEVQ